VLYIFIIHFYSSYLCNPFPYQNSYSFKILGRKIFYATGHFLAVLKLPFACSLFNLRPLLVLPHTHSQTARITKRYKNIAQHYARAPQAAVSCCCRSHPSAVTDCPSLFLPRTPEADPSCPGFGRLGWLGLARPEAPRLNDVFWAPQK